MKKRYLFGAAAVALILVACHDESEPVMVQAPSVQQQPVYQQPPVVVQNGLDHGFMSGLMMGHLMSGNSHRPSVVHHYTTRTVIKRSYSPRRSYYGARRSGRR